MNKTDFIKAVAADFTPESKSADVPERTGDVGSEVSGVYSGNEKHVHLQTGRYQKPFRQRSFDRSPLLRELETMRSGHSNFEVRSGFRRTVEAGNPRGSSELSVLSLRQ